MRSSLVISSLFLAIFSHAQNSDSVPATSPTEAVNRIQDRSMVDLGYLVPQGEVGLGLFANVYTEAYEIEINATRDSDVAIVGNRLGIELSYGIFDDLNISAGLSYVPNRSTKEDISNVRADSRGWEEPRFSLLYRVLAQNELSPLDVVLGISHSPKTEDLKWATQDSEGTPARGGDATTVGLGFYRRASTGEFGLTLSHIALGGTEGKSASGSTAISEKATGKTSVMGMGQFPVGDNVYVRAGAGLTHNQEAEITSATVTKIEAHGTVDFLGGMRVSIVPNRSMVDLSINVQAPATSEIEIDIDGTPKKLVNSTRAQFFAGLKFLY